MKFGLQHPNFTFDGQGAEVVEKLRTLAQRAEKLGFDSFWVMDHFHQIRSAGQLQEPILESWTTQAVVAGLTEKIKLGTLVTGIVYRHPSVLAKMGATLDVLSKGRLIMGIGAAWNVDEATAYGIPFPPVKERMQRLEEAVQIIRKMWTEESATFSGKFYQVRDAYCNPKPIQKPHPPIMIGGGGERRTLKIVAKYADACNIFGSVETVKKKFGVLRGHCRSVGRDYDSIVKSKVGRIVIEKDKEKLAEAVKNMSEVRRQEYVRLEYAIYGTPEEVRRQVEAFRDVGVEYLIVNLEPDRELQALELFADEVVKKL
ncbi:MAG: LLM class F420-dependent oxidoreductase [Candidatus Bathyarchaeia archaeon]